MKRILHIAILVLLALSCTREKEMEPVGEDLPIGVPTMLTIPFGSDDLMQVEVGTKADAGFINESNIHDLYVFLFDYDDPNEDGSPNKIYGRYFNFDHRRSSLAELNAHHNECWYVENKSINSPSTTTRGAVKISTVTRTHVMLVVLANVDNSVMEMDSENEIERLNAVQDLEELKGLTVSLEQDIVNRKNLFLMMGALGNDGTGISTANMRWNKPVTSDTEYDPDYKVNLRTLNAKVKFRIKVNPTYISAVTPVYWQVCRTPNSCYLFEDYDDGKAPESIYYFDSQQSYFEDKETVGNETYYTFCFYMLENRLLPTKNATKYYQREVQTKTVSPDAGYDGPSSNTYLDHFVENGDWEYANPNSTYVKFDLVLTLTKDGIENLGGSEEQEGIKIGNALTSDAIFTVHLGDFTNSNPVNNETADFNNYNTERGHSYTYNVTINNTKSIYTEVISDREEQAGQEGFLLLTDDEIINADAHYEYHQLTFEYRPDMQQEKFSWYVKTPFGEGGPKIVFDQVQNKFTYSTEGLDYLWVKFGVNEAVDGTASSASWDPNTEKDPLPWDSEEKRIYPYSKRRHKYPGDSHYDPTWEPEQRVADGVPVNYGPSDPNDPMYRMIPDLMDITQLIRYIFWETSRETAHRNNPSAPESAFIADDGNSATVPVIRFTAFIDEYYYEEHPIEHTVDPDLWRKFVNAQPREMHILSDAQQSRDRKSDVILSSHSIIQQSIQTIYNISAANLHTLWGTEHEDEMRKLTNGWPYWPNDPIDGTKASDVNKDARSGAYTELGKWNGRLNSAYIWEFYSSRTESGNDLTGQWSTFLDYNVHNEIPELKAPSGVDNGYQGMAYSCLTRNRDNNGDGAVDRSEIRWYLAACNQLAGMWVGNESLSINARLYMPAQGQWRSHIMSSTDKRVSWSEEGGGATDYTWDFVSGYYTWNNIGAAAAGESVRCLRNIGTFTEDGTVKDISYAPYNYEIEHYFTKEGSGPEGPFTFYFDRLNPKSLRQMSETELPYADQFNMFNCVYLKFETQSRADNVGDTPADSFDKLNTQTKNTYPTTNTINLEVSQLGHNPYCPPGYRFPNHSEMLLMSLYLPKEYLENDKDGVEYENANLPTRTYFDRGCFGLNTTGMENCTDEQIAHEQNKVGWCYTLNHSKQSCLNKGVKIYHSRCVRDVDMTGYIDGSISLPISELLPGDEHTVKFHFFSSASAFVYAELKLCYTDHDGNYDELDIPVKTQPSGLQYNAEQIVEIPTLAQLHLTEADMKTDKKNMKLKIELRNAAGTVSAFEEPFALAESHLTKCSLSFPSESDPDKGIPVRVQIGNRNNKATLDNVTLYWKAPTGSWQHIVLEDGSHNLTTFDHVEYLSDIIGNSWNTEANRYKEYQFYVIAECSDNTRYVSKTISNQLFYFYKRPNVDRTYATYPNGGDEHLWNDPWWQEGTNPWVEGNHASTWFQSLPKDSPYTNMEPKRIICNTLPAQKIEHLRFSKGDYIEALLDVTQCVFIRTVEGSYADKPKKDQVVGLDNVFAIGSTNKIGWVDGTVQCYYPAHTDASGDNRATDKLQIDALYTTKDYSKLQAGELGSPLLKLKLSSKGLWWNDNLITDYGTANRNTVVPNLVSGEDKTLYVGAVEGAHLTRALYKYVRAIRVKDNPDVTPIPRD